MDVCLADWAHLLKICLFLSSNFKWARAAVTSCDRYTSICISDFPVAVTECQDQGILEKGEFSLAYGSGGVKVQPERWQMWQQRVG